MRLIAAKYYNCYSSVQLENKYCRRMVLKGVGLKMLLTLLVGFIGFVAATDQESISAKSGDDITLFCKVPGGTAVDAVEWSKENETVLYFRPGQPGSLDQHPSYGNRATPLNWKVENGDGSLLLKNATTNDSRPYICTAQIDGQFKLINSTKVKVFPPGKQDGNSSIAQIPEFFSFAAGIGVVFVVGFAVVGILIYCVMKRRNSRSLPQNSSADGASQQIEMEQQNSGVY